MNGPSASPAFMERMVSFYSLLPFVHYHLRTQGALCLSRSTPQIALRAGLRQSHSVNPSQGLLSQDHAMDSQRNKGASAHGLAAPESLSFLVEWHMDPLPPARVDMMTRPRKDGLFSEPDGSSSGLDDGIYQNSKTSDVSFVHRLS